MKGIIFKMKEKEHAIIFKEPNKNPIKMQIDNRLESEQELIKGYIQKLDITADAYLICDEDGKLKGLQPNIQHKKFGKILGNIFIVGRDSKTGEFASLSESQIEKYIEELNEISIHKYSNYKEMIESHQKEFNKFPIHFAFTKEQLKEGMEKLGLTEKDIDKIVDVGAGGFIRKSDIEAYNNLGEKFKTEMQQAIMEDYTGENFIKEMFIEEMINHEYILVRDIETVLEAVGLDMNEINKFNNLKHGLQLAEKEYLKGCNSFESEEEMEE